MLSALFGWLESEIVDRGQHKYYIISADKYCNIKDDDRCYHRLWSLSDLIGSFSVSHTLWGKSGTFDKEVWLEAIML